VLSIEHLKELMGTADPMLKDEEQPATDRLVERDQTSRVVEDAIEKLPEVYREALVLRDIDGLSYEEIGEILEIPGGTVRSRINRARLMLKDKLKSFARTEL
jgi:RNA polymerase sigma-70 factor (ECF subfamily)